MRSVVYRDGPAYPATALVHDMRVAQHYKPLGRKIGFTNYRMRDEYRIPAEAVVPDYALTLNSRSRPG
jgi:hypothetical protein